MNKPFLILMPMGRVGSNALVDMLDQTRKFRVDNEPTTVLAYQIRSAAGGAWNAEQKQSCADAQRDWSGKFLNETVVRPNLIIGAKIAFDSLIDPHDFAAALREHDGNTVFLFRRNVVKQAVSILRARLNAERMKEKYGKAKYGVEKAEDILPATAINSDDLYNLCMSCQENLNRSRAFATWLGWPILTIEYAEMFADLPKSVSQVGDFLGAGALPSSTKWIKGTSDSLKSVILNFDEILAEPRFAPFADLLRDDKG